MFSLARTIVARIIQPRLPKPGGIVLLTKSCNCSCGVSAVDSIDTAPISLLTDGSAVLRPVFTIPDLLLGPGRPNSSTHSFSHCFISAAPFIDIHFETELVHLGTILLVIIQGTFTVGFYKNNEGSDLLEDHHVEASESCSLSLDCLTISKAKMQLRKISDGEGAYLVFYSIPHDTGCLDVSIDMHTEDITSRLALAYEDYIESQKSAELFRSFLGSNINHPSFGSIDQCIPPLEHFFMYIELQIPS